jgi:SagB-type dehydrogenase family enzyme
MGEKMRRVRVVLPPVAAVGMSLGEAIRGRRSVREYGDGSLTMVEVAQLLWAAQGVVRGGYRTVPSAGATFPLAAYLVARRVEGLESGVYRYEGRSGELVLTVEGDVSRSLAGAALGQECVGEGAVVVVLAADYGRTTGRYGERGIRYVHMEVGHAGQNVSLVAEALGLGTVVVGAFEDARVASVLALPREEVPLYLLPVGRLRGG